MAIVHVNSNTIRSNKKHQAEQPPLSVRKTRSAKAAYCDEVEIFDGLGNVVARVVYQPSTPLSCGAQVWIETVYDVGVNGHVSKNFNDVGVLNEQ
jgi:hypothetical protein